jgi:hypothetical protein
MYYHKSCFTCTNTTIAAAAIYYVNVRLLSKQLFKEMVELYSLVPDKVTINEATTACKVLAKWDTLAEVGNGYGYANG